MDLPTELVLVTGATGWLGSRLVEVLGHGLANCEPLAEHDAKLRIRCLVLPHENTSKLEALGDRIEIVRGDVSRPEDCTKLCKGAESAIAFHTAGIIHPRRTAQFYKVNLEGTRNLLEACVRARVRRVVAVSSNSPCGVNPHPDHVFDEASPYRPYMHYGRSKMLMEKEVGRYQTSGKIETVIIRAPWFYGPNQPPRQNQFFRMIRDGTVPIVGGGANRRSMAYVDNLCQGLILAAMSESANGQIYWIADERPYSMNEIVDTVERLLETEFKQTCTHSRTRLPSAVSEVAWVIDKTLQGLGLYHQKFHVLSEMNKTIACSVEKAKAELGYRPTTSLEEGMRQSLRWIWQNQGGLDEPVSQAKR